LPAKRRLTAAATSVGPKGTPDAQAPTTRAMARPGLGMRAEVAVVLHRRHRRRLRNAQHLDGSRHGGFERFETLRHLLQLGGVAGSLVAVMDLLLRVERLLVSVSFDLLAQSLQRRHLPTAP